MKEKDDFIFIAHILESISAIKIFSKGLSREELSSKRLNQSAIVREIEIIGEACKNISEETKNKNREIKWKEISGTRDKMIHHYFGIDLDIIWEIIKTDLPVLEKQLIDISK